MIPKECKRLAEVDFPIAVVSKHSAREKSIRHGHPSTLHLWWARRPLAACRAMLLGLLLPDPCDAYCPEDFKEKARGLLPKVQGAVGPKDEALRHALLKFIGDFANWDNSSHPVYLEVGRGLVKAAHPEETPLVVDPFAGGGSIPLEALRLGCETFASDLNPVACLILKVMLEDIPRHGPELAVELRKVGAKIKEEAEKELAEFYPTDPDGSRPIAYLWARTVRCETPNCGAEIPLVRSFWLCKKTNRKRALMPIVTLSQRERGIPHVEFEIFEPKSDNEVLPGTVTRAKATCPSPSCNTVLSPDRVRAQLSAQRGGADVIFNENGVRIGGARLLAVVTLKPGVQGRYYRLPTDQDYTAVWQAQQRISKILDEWVRGGRKGLCPVPDEPTPPRNGHRSTTAPRVYGMTSWRDLYSVRQAIALISYAKKIACYRSNSVQTDPVAEMLALVLSKLSERLNVICDWMVGVECSGHLFSHHDIPAAWDHSEAVPIQASSGSFESALNVVESCLLAIGNNWTIGQVDQSDACRSSLPDDSVGVWFTDPPYYDAVAYSDLSNLFYTWLKRALPGHKLLHDEVGDYSLTPKYSELTVTTAFDEGSAPKNALEFEAGIQQAFAEGRRVLSDNGIGSIVFAHKTTEGWESLLSAIVKAGWTISASWPLITERGSRQNARNTASLASSIHLVCRPRPEDAPVGDWSEVLRELPNRVGDWMERLQTEGIRGADLVFACIGPALEIFSRYSKVETTEGHEVKLAEYLEKVWEVVGRTALEQILGTAEAKARNGASSALEEDARLTALFLWTLQSTNGENNSPSPQPSPAEGEGEIPSGGDEDILGEEDDELPKTKPKGFSLVFDVVRRFAQPLGIHLQAWEGRIIETKKGVVRLFSISERAKQLFGEEGAHAIADRIERSPEGSAQLTLFAVSQDDAVPEIKGRGRQRKGMRVSEESMRGHGGATTLDRVHAAMLLQASGRANALRSLLKAEMERSPDFLRLANALSALYPKGSEEKRLLDAMLLAVPR